MATRVYTQSEFDEFIDRRARKLIAEAASANSVDTLQNSKQSNKIAPAKMDKKMFGAKTSNGNSAPNADWTTPKTSGKKDVKPNSASSENSSPTPTGGVQKAKPADGKLFMNGHKGSKVGKFSS